VVKNSVTNEVNPGADLLVLIESVEAEMKKYPKNIHPSKKHILKGARGYYIL